MGSEATGQDATGNDVESFREGATLLEPSRSASGSSAASSQSGRAPRTMRDPLSHEPSVLRVNTPRLARHEAIIALLRDLCTKAGLER